MRPKGLNGISRLTAAFLVLALAGCGVIDSRPPMLGEVANGVYTQPQGNFSCSLQAPALGLIGRPQITDAVVLTRNEHIPLSQRKPGDWRNNRVIYEGTEPARTVRLEYPSGAVVEIGSGRRTHPVEQLLASRMSGGVSWRFDRREVERPAGRMMLGLLLVPWHEEGVTYMGVSPADAWRKGQGPDAELWIPVNIVIKNAHHHISVQLPAAPLLSPNVAVRDLTGIRDDIQSRPELRERLLGATSEWLAGCRFAEDIQ